MFHTLPFKRAYRAAVRRPVQSAASVACLAVGIGAASAVFATLDALLLGTPAGVHSPARLVRALFQSPTQVTGPTLSRHTSGPAFAALRQNLAPTAALAAYFPMDASLGRGSTARSVRIAFVSSTFFKLLGVRFRFGHGFENGSDDAAGPLQAVISETLWRSAFGSVPDIVGRTVQLNGHAMQVQGVVAEDFAGLDALPTQLWAPLDNVRQFAPFSLTSRRASWVRVVAGIQSHVTLHDLSMRATQVVRDIEGRNDVDVVLTPLSRLTLQGSIATEVPRWIAWAAVALLLATWANVASLALARTVADQDALRMRVILGAKARDLARDALLELGLLTCAGAALGAILALALVRMAARMLGTAVVSGWLIRVGTIGVLVSVLTVGICALAPVLYSRVVERHIGVGLGRVERRSTTRIQLLFCAAQLAILVPLGVAAIVVAREFHTRVSRDLGVSLDGVLVATANLSANGFSKTHAAAVWPSLRDAVMRVPGVTAASLVSFPPYTSSVFMGAAPAGGGKGSFVSLLVTDSAYFDLVRLRLIRGREYGDITDQNAAHVAVIDERVARAFWPDADPLGKCVKMSNADASDCTTVIGVAASIRSADPTSEAPPAILVPRARYPLAIGALLIRSRKSSNVSVRALRQAFAAAVPDLPFVQVQPATQALEPQRRPWRAALALFGGAASLVLVLASLGLYGVMSLFVGERLREFGIRIALGGSAHHIIWTVLVHMARVIMWGAAFGVVGTFMIIHVVEAKLPSIEAPGPAMILEVFVVLSAVAVGAALPAAVRAARADPVRVIREEV